MVFRAPIDAERRAYFRFLVTIHGKKKQDIVRNYNISRTSLYRILKNETRAKRAVHIEETLLIGRPQKLTSHVERLLLRQIDVLRRKEGSFTIKRLMCEAGINPRTVSYETAEHLLYRHGYK